MPVNTLSQPAVIEIIRGEKKKNTRKIKRFSAKKSLNFMLTQNIEKPIFSPTTS